jgi:hypothetical protein
MTTKNVPVPVNIPLNSSAEIGSSNDCPLLDLFPTERDAETNQMSSCTTRVVGGVGKLVVDRRPAVPLIASAVRQTASTSDQQSARHERRPGSDSVVRSISIAALLGLCVGLAGGGSVGFAVGQRKVAAVAVGEVRTDSPAPSGENAPADLLMATDADAVASNDPSLQIDMPERSGPELAGYPTSPPAASLGRNSGKPAPQTVGKRPVRRRSTMNGGRKRPTSRYSPLEPTGSRRSPHK